MEEYNLVIEKNGLRLTIKVYSIGEALGILEEVDGGFFRVTDEKGRVKALGYIAFPRDGQSPGRSALLVLLDQMFKGLGGLLAERIRCASLQVIEVNEDAQEAAGTGGVSYLRVQTDDDILGVLRRLQGKGMTVLFTGDKRLASRAKRETPGVRVQYMPPGKHNSRNEIVDEMALRIEALASIQCRTVAQSK